MKIRHRRRFGRRGLTDFFTRVPPGHLIIAVIVGFFGDMPRSKWHSVGCDPSVGLAIRRRFLGLGPGRCIRSASESRLTVAGPLAYRLARCGVGGGYLARQDQGKTFQSGAVTLRGVGVWHSARRAFASRPRVNGLDRDLSTAGRRAFKSWRSGLTSRAAAPVAAYVSDLSAGGGEFSFLIAVPVLCAAPATQLLKRPDHLSVDDVIGRCLVFVISFAWRTALKVLSAT